MTLLRSTVVASLLVLGGCDLGATDSDDGIDGVVALSSLANGGAEVCATYEHEHLVPDESPVVTRRWRRIELDAQGHAQDRDGDCSAAGTVDPSHIALADGGFVALTPLDAQLTRFDAGGATVWSVPSPFGTLEAAVESSDGNLLLAGGPEVARLALSDGSVSWVVALR